MSVGALRKQQEARAPISEETRERMRVAAKRRASTPEHIERVRAYWQPFCSREQLEADYVNAGMSQAEICTKYGVSLKRVQTSMRRFGIAPRPACPRNQRGDRGHGWKGNEAGYDALHLRVATLRGLPAECSQCEKRDPGKRYEWANLTGHYDDPMDYMRMCVSCHRTYDAMRRRSNGGLCTIPDTLQRTRRRGGWE